MLLYGVCVNTQGPLFKVLLSVLNYGETSRKKTLPLVELIEIVS